MMEQDVSVADIDINKVRCPHCNSSTVVLRGSGLVDRTEVWENGEITSFSTEPDSICFEVEHIDCLVCNHRTNLLPDRVMQMQNMLYRMRKQIMDLGGEDPLGLGKIN